MNICSVWHNFDPITFHYTENSYKNIPHLAGIRFSSPPRNILISSRTHPLSAGGPFPWGRVPGQKADHLHLMVRLTACSYIFFPSICCLIEHRDNFTINCVYCYILTADNLKHISPSMGLVNQSSLAVCVCVYVISVFWFDSRYCYEGGYPLLLYPAQDFPVTCVHCHNKMFFEIQVLPTLVSKLRLLGPGGEGVHLEFGTVLVFTCLKSCWTTTDTWREERIVVQAEKI